MTILKFGRGGLGFAKWWNFIPMAIKALHIEAFMSKVQRAKVMLMFWGRRKLIRSPEGIERRWRPRSWFKYIEMG
jgi:hypothetical protein